LAHTRRQGDNDGMARDDSKAMLRLVYMSHLDGARPSTNVAFYVLRAARAVPRRRPRMAAGSALVAAGSVARLRAASAEPLR